MKRRGREMFLREAIVSNMSTEAFACDMHTGNINKALIKNIERIFL
jgi:hypothetical protein